MLQVQGAGTVISVLTIVIDAPNDKTLPFIVTGTTLLTVEIVEPASERILPTMVPPPAALMVAVLPTCHDTFLAKAPPAKITL